METSSAEQYVESLLERDPMLEKVKEAIRARNMPEVSVAPGYGKLLTMLVSMTGASRVLEIGSLGGYSGICLARGLSKGGKLVSLELRQDYADLAYSHLREAGFGDAVEYRVGEALNSLKQLDEEGQRFDVFFIDADKGNYPHYLDWAIKLSNPGALIIGDNTLLHGRIMNPNSNGNSVTQMRKFNERMVKDPRLMGVVLPAYDGLAIARVTSLG